MIPDELTSVDDTLFKGGAGLRLDDPLVREYAMFEELRFVYREAEAEASVAYEAWSATPSRIAYAVYRAAQERADAAQDALAAFGVRFGGSRGRR